MMISFHWIFTQKTRQSLAGVVCAVVDVSLSAGDAGGIGWRLLRDSRFFHAFTHELLPQQFIGELGHGNLASFSLVIEE